MSEASARDSRRLARPLRQRLREPTIGFERVAELLVSGRVVRTREQQRVAVVSGAARPVLDEAQADLLVVGIVAFLHRADRQGRDEGRAIVAGIEIGAGPSNATGRPER